MILHIELTQIMYNLACPLQVELNDLRKNANFLIETLKDVEAKANEFNCNRLSDKILLKLRRSFLDQDEPVSR